MAVNKRKILDAARKFAQKGAKGKALKEYNRLLKLDPKDAKLHLEIGDVYRRWGDIEDATVQYTRVADQYKKDGFDARAVAVFKQILNLDPKRYSAYVSLSDLYQRMGLNSEAANSLQSATDGMFKEGKKREGLELLRRMTTLDPTNTTSRMKVAGLLQQEGLDDDAIAEYQGVAEELLRQGAGDSVADVYERIIEIEPDRVDVLEKLSRNLIELGQPQRAEPFARRALEAQPGNTDHYEFLCQLYKSLDRPEDLAETTRALAKVYRERGDEEKARAVIQRLPSSGDDLLDDAIDLDAIGAVVAEPDDGLDVLGEQGDLLEEEGFLSDHAGALGGLSLDQPLEKSGPQPSKPPGPRAPAAPEGDPDQLLAEASVYLRYRKRDQAMASLEAVLAQDPQHVGALEKLGETYAEDGDGGLAVETWKKAAQIAQSRGEDAVFGILCDRISALDPEAADELRPAVGDTSGPQLDDENDLDFDVDHEGYEELADAGEDEQIEVDEEAEAYTLVEQEDEGLELEIDVDDGIEVQIHEEDDGDPTPDDAVRGDSALEQVSEQLEEAEFFFEQKMFDEAQAMYRSVLELCPNHPSALVRLGELAKARGEDPSDPRLVAADRPSPVDPIVDDGIDIDIDIAAEDLEDEPLPYESADDLEVVEPSLAAAPTARKKRTVDAQVGSLADAGATFDLAAELSNAFEDDDAGDPTQSMGHSTISEGVDSVFSDFKRGVSETLSEGDTETRYDLGIAYREMELLEDAIDEFRLCVGSATRRLDSLHMLGLCALDLGRIDDAIVDLKEAIGTPGLPAEKNEGLHFDLGRAFEELGDGREALQAYEAVVAADSGFPGIKERISSLKARAANPAPAAPAAANDFESFDDLVAEVEALSDAQEGYESLEDVISEVEAEGADVPGSAAKKSGKKKISFL